MPDLAQKRSILEPFLGSKKYNTCFIGYCKTKEHAWTKKYCKKILSKNDPLDNSVIGVNFNAKMFTSDSSTDPTFQ